MADAVEFTPNLASELERFLGDAPRDIATAMRSTTSLLARQVADKVPVLTGTLAASVKPVEADYGMDVGVGLGEGVPYAAWIEFGGSRGRDAVPQGRYLYPTLVTAQPMAQTAFENATQIAIDEFGWSSNR